MKLKFILIVAVLLMPLMLFAQAITGSWDSASSVGFIARYGHASCVVDNKIYVMGGHPNNSFTDTLEIFDPVANSWQIPKVSGYFTPRYDLTASLVNRKIFAIGGEFGGQSIFEVFNLSTNNWSTPVTTGTFTPRFGLTSNVVGGKIFVFGGGQYPSIPLNTVEVFDPATNAWSTPVTSGTFTARFGHTSALVNGKIYVIGGYNHGVVISDIEVFDPSTSQWSTLSTTGTYTPRWGLSSTVLDGKIYVIGGEDATGNAKNTVEVLDPVTQSWTTPKTTDVFGPREYQVSNEVNGKIYVIGGLVTFSQDTLIPVEVFTLSSTDVKPLIAPPVFNLFPNLTNGIISVSGTLENTMSITITNILGERVIELSNPHRSNFTIDLSKLAPGIYTARFGTPNSVIVKKIIKK